MNKIWTIFKREYLTRVLTKGFIIGTVIAPILLLLMAIGPQFLIRMKSEQVSKLTVIDQTNEIYGQLVNALADTLESGQQMFKFNLM